MLALKFLLVVSFVYFYQEGGQGKKWIKSWIAPSVLAALIILIAFLDHRLKLFTFIGALCYLAAANGFAYGVKFTKGKTILKILFRGLCGLSYGICGAIVTHNFLPIILSTSGSILFGVLNPFPSKWGDWATRTEDICIALSYVAIIPFFI